MEAFETFTHNGKTVELHYDQDGSTSNPRDCDNLGTFWTQERRHNSPDKLPVRGNILESVVQEFGGSQDQTGIEKALDRGAIWLPVWKYEHSGCAYRAAKSNPFHCPWDSGQAGFIFAKKDAVRKEYGVSRITAKVRAKVLEVLKAEVETYGQWANGEVYGFIVKDTEGEEVDSCWGIIGREYVREAATEAAV